MNWNLLLLKLSTRKSQILLWESFKDIHLWTLLTLIASTYKLLDNISKEQKSVCLLGDFNVNLLNYNEHNQTNEFIDSLASNLFIPLILQPTRIASPFNTFLDNIFLNVIDPDIISCNLTATISDPLFQFAINPNMFGNILSNKSNIYEKD